MLYSRIFDWIVRIVNDMQINMFEQMFINLTNEHIQLLFNCVMVETELEVYRQEDIKSIFHVPPSSQPCLDLFLAKKPQGIAFIIAEQA